MSLTSRDRYKVLSLLFQAGWKHMLQLWSVSVVSAFVLSFCNVLPLPFSIVPEFAEYHAHHCPYFPWCLVFSFVGSFLGLVLTPYFPALCGRHPVCFLDVVSIHQVDQELMERGVYGLGGFLRVSKELRVLWSAPYLSRLGTQPSKIPPDQGVPEFSQLLPFVLPLCDVQS